MSDIPASQQTVLYGSFTCPMVPSVRSTLERAGVHYQYVNISTDAEARARLKEINNGYESVPTLEFSDGSTLTEPSVLELVTKLESMGHYVPAPTLSDRVRGLVLNPIVLTFGLVFLLMGALSADNNLLIIGAVILAIAMAVVVVDRVRRQVQS